MDKLLTKKDLAARWQVTERTIDNYISDKIVQPVKDLPIIRFTEQHIAELEGVKLDRMSPLERRRMEQKIEKLEKQNEQLKGIISKVLAETSQIINMEAS
jgi:hypothetical protein